MGKRRNLKGLPNDLTQRYFSTMFYNDGGYMADWIWNSAIRNGKTEIRIDILNKTIEPKVIEIKPLTMDLSRLQETIRTSLYKNGFGEHYIKEAHFDIYISHKFKTMRSLTCTATLKDEKGFEYRGETYTEKSFDDRSWLSQQSISGQSLLDRLKKWFRG